VEVGGAERLGVPGAELEDVADLDRGLDPDRAPLDRIAGLDAADVAALEREVAARLDATQVPVGPVGAGHVAAVRDSLVEQDRHVDTDRPDEPGRPDALGDLLVARGPEVLAE